MSERKDLIAFRKQDQEFYWYKLKSISLLQCYIQRLLIKSKKQDSKDDILSSSSNLTLKELKKKYSNGNTNSFQGSAFSFQDKRIVNQSKSTSVDIIPSGNIKEIESLVLKTKANKYFMNLILVTFWSRYLDMITKVKYGGLCFLILSASSLYYSNKYYDKYSLYIVLRKINQVKGYPTINALIDSVLEQDIICNRDESFTRKELSKYWKEPMAWH
mmetsp:Transcript_16477/g.17133  ORF Transcript_16477/g.17133 Transcript_16477/m.17133 type:complete len:216 (+) Transcript_16477:14-661(+)